MATKATPTQIWVSGRQTKIDPAKTYKVWNKNISKAPELTPMEGSKLLEHLRNRTAKFELGKTDFRSFPR
jgi:hypothetical protein